MEGFYGQTMFGGIRYWPNVPIFTDDPTTVPLYHWQLTQGERPEILTEWAAAGTLQSIWGFGFLFPAGALVAGWIPGLARPTYDAENDIWRVNPPTPITEIRQWQPGGYEEIAVERDRTKPWRLVIRDANNSTLANVTAFWNARVLAKTDEAGELSFRCRYHETFRTHLSGENYIWLYDGFGLLREKYQIMQVRRVREGEARIVEVRCLSMISKLSREPVANYTTPVETSINAKGEVVERRLVLPVRTVVRELLDLQQNSGPRILAGTIDPGIGNFLVRYAAEETTIYDALRGLQLLLPAPLRGVFTVDAENRLNWSLRVGPQQLRMELGKELKGIEYALDYTDLVTRVYLYGQGQDTETPLSLTDAGWPTPYMSRNVGRYGVVALRKQDNRIKYPETLINVARRILEDFAEPLLELRIDALELSKADTVLAGSFIDIVPGAQYRIVDAGTGVDTTVQIVQCEYDVADPVAVKLQLKNRTRRLSDLFAYLLRQLNPRIPMDRLIASLLDNDRMRDGIYQQILDMLESAIADALSELPEYFGDQLRERFTELMTEIIERIMGERDDEIDAALLERLDQLTAQHFGLSRLLPAKIASIGDNTMECYLWDTNEGDWAEATTTVYKPHLFRKDIYHTASITYQNGQRIIYAYVNPYTRYGIDQDSLDEEFQEITPNYFVDDVIVAGRYWTGEAHRWLDLNFSGRAWAKIEVA